MASSMVTLAASRLGPDKLPGLPQEVWEVLARAALAGCSDSLGAWLRLRAVCRDWRQALDGVYPHPGI